MVELAEYEQLVTSEHNQKPKFMATLGLSVQPFVDAQNLLLGMPLRYDLDVSVGQQMDTDALWIGVNRFVDVPLASVYFSWNTLYLGWQEGVWQGQFDPSTGVISLDDDTFRLLLKARVIANNWDGTIADGNPALETLFSGSTTPATDVYMYDFQDMTSALIISGQWPSMPFQAVLTTGELGLKAAGVTMRYLKVSANGQPIYGMDVAADLINGWDKGVVLVPIDVQATSQLPILDLDFTIVGTLDPHVTFTRTTTATYIDAGGVMRAAAINAPRWDYNVSTHALNGLLIEDARTNQIASSNTASPGGNATASTDIAALYAPATVWKAITVKGGANYGAFAQLVIQNQVAFASVWMWIPSTYSAADGAPRLDMDGIRGVDGTVSIGSADLSKRNQWQRVVSRLYLGAAGGTGGTAYNFVIRNSAPFGGGNAFYYTCPQSEVNADYVSSYVAGTRAKDVVSILPANMVPWFNPLGGSWYMDFTVLGLTPNSGYINGGTDASPLLVALDLTLAQSDLNGEVSTANIVTKAVPHKGISIYGAAIDHGRICLDGGAIGFGSLTEGYAELATKGIALFGTAPESVNGYLRAIKYWALLMSDADMQALTG